MKQLTTPWGPVDVDVEVDGAGAVDLWAGPPLGMKPVGQYDCEEDAIADIEHQGRWGHGPFWRITSSVPSGDTLPVYERRDDAWSVIGLATTRAQAEAMARASGGRTAAYRPAGFGPEGYESWEILR